MKKFVRGDIDGFVGLFIDNLVQFLVIISLCGGLLGFGPELLLKKVLPGAALSLVAGNLFYAWQAHQMAKKSQRTDYCALPYGINTPSVFAYVFLVMLPVKITASSSGHDDPSLLAWQVGLVACLGSGLIEMIGSLGAEKIRKMTPRAALLSTLAGIALGFISFGFLFRSFTYPVVGLVTLGSIFMFYFGKVKIKGNLPGGFVALIIGVTLCWVTGLRSSADIPATNLGLYLPVPVIGDILSALRGDEWLAYLGIIIPMGLFNVIGSLQNLESAEVAGDKYHTGSSLFVNGFGTSLGALFGSCFPTTIYIGHPGWKALGARAGYSVLNAVVCTIICCSGLMLFISWLIPIEAGMAIVVWIGLVISSQAFGAVPAHHMPAVVVGLLPGLGAWGILLAKSGYRIAGGAFDEDIIYTLFLKAD
ncbi:MAG: NCS2 family permease, partial [Planctomycetes bacterium]|nr:NCS2 family permease [Planctomycetota bacterium]